MSLANSPVYPTVLANTSDSTILGFEDEPIEPGCLATYCGLKTRQYFVGLAMQGLVASGAELSYKETAEIAVRLADAIIHQLESDNTNEQDSHNSNNYSNATRYTNATRAEPKG